MLNEMSDVEIVWLRFYFDGTWEFSERHENVLAPAEATLASSRNEQDKAARKTALQDSYIEHLCQLGLLERRYRVDMRSKEPKFGANGVQEVADYATTPLGHLLLRQIGLGGP